MDLRDYQVDAVYQTRKAAAQGSVILQLPTGAGKTVVAGDMIKRALAKGRRVAFLVPYISLIDQTWQSFAKQGITDIGVVQADHWLYDPAAPVQVCSVDTLARRLAFPEVDLVIIDEAHRRSSFVNAWMRKGGPTFVGLTATPWAKGMANHWDHLIIGETVRGLIDRGFLSDFRVFAPSSPDLKGVRVVAGEYHQGQLGQAVSNRKLIASITDTWLERSTGEKTILFAVNRAHAAELQASFIERDIPAGYIDAHTSPQERSLIADQFHSGEVKVVCNVGCLVAGVDWDVRTLILAAPTRSEIKYVQMVGRALRTAPGKEYALILDHSDTTQRLGFVTDIHYDELCDGSPDNKKERKEKEEVLPKPCPNCGALKTTKVCPACGYQYVPTGQIETEDGHLVEVKAPKFTQKRVAEIHGMFLSHAREKGYKDRWAYHKTMQMTGLAPRGRGTPTQPDQKVLDYIKHINIKNARQRKSSTETSTRNS